MLFYGAETWRLHDDWKKELKFQEKLLVSGEHKQVPKEQPEDWEAQNNQKWRAVDTSRAVADCGADKRTKFIGHAVRGPDGCVAKTALE